MRLITCGHTAGTEAQTPFHFHCLVKAAEVKSVSQTISSVVSEALVVTNVSIRYKRLRVCVWSEG